MKSQEHHHHEIVGVSARILLLAIVINICFVAAEATVGWYLIGPILSLLVSFVIAVPSVKLIIRTIGKIKS